MESKDVAALLLNALAADIELADALTPRADRRYCSDYTSPVLDRMRRTVADLRTVLGVS